MLSSVLRSKRAVQVNIAIMRTFVRLRQMLASHKDLARKLEALEVKYNAQFKVVFDAIRKLKEPSPAPSRRWIGFTDKGEDRNWHHYDAQGTATSIAILETRCAVIARRPRCGRAWVNRRGKFLR